MSLPIHTAKYDKPRLIDRGWRGEQVLFYAWREGRERTRGYGMTEEEAIFDLKNNVQPDWTGELDGEGPYPTPAVSGNIFPREKLSH